LGKSKKIQSHNNASIDYEKLDKRIRKHANTFFNKYFDKLKELSEEDQMFGKINFEYTSEIDDNNFKNSCSS